jgi:hypothetical protein
MPVIFHTLLKEVGSTVEESNYSQFLRKYDSILPGNFWNLKIISSSVLYLWQYVDRT